MTNAHNRLLNQLDAANGQRQLPARPRSSGRQSRVESPQSARSQRSRASDRQPTFLVIDIDGLVYAPDARDELPQLRTRTGGRAAEDAAWTCATHPVKRAEDEAYSNTLVDGHVNMKQRM